MASESLGLAPILLLPLTRGVTSSELFNFWDPSFLLRVPTHLRYDSKCILYVNIY